MNVSPTGSQSPSPPASPKAKQKAADKVPDSGQKDELKGAQAPTPMPAPSLTAKMMQMSMSSEATRDLGAKPKVRTHSESASHQVEDSSDPETEVKTSASEIKKSKKKKKKKRTKEKELAKEITSTNPTQLPLTKLPTKAETQSFTQLLTKTFIDETVTALTDVQRLAENLIVKEDSTYSSTRAAEMAERLRRKKAMQMCSSEKETLAVLMDKLLCIINASTLNLHESEFCQNLKFLVEPIFAFEDEDPVTGFQQRLFHGNKHEKDEAVDVLVAFTINTRNWLKNVKLYLSIQEKQAIQLPKKQVTQAELFVFEQAENTASQVITSAHDFVAQARAFYAQIIKHKNSNFTLFEKSAMLDLANVFFQHCQHFSNYLKTNDIEKMCRCLQHTNLIKFVLEEIDLTTEKRKDLAQNSLTAHNTNSRHIQREVSMMICMVNLLAQQLQPRIQQIRESMEPA